MDDISHPIFSYHPSGCLGCMPLVCLWNIPCTQNLTLHFLGNPVAGCPWQACPGRLPLNETISKFYSNLNRAAGAISSRGGTACCPSESWQTGRIRFCNISFGDQMAKPEQVFGDSQSPSRLSKTLTLGKRRGQSCRALTYSVICVFSLITPAFIMLVPST